MSEHTEEPWYISDDIYIAKETGRNTGFVLGKIWSKNGPPQRPFGVTKKVAKANARRVVACVNICKGIPNKELSNIKDLGNIREYLIKQGVPSAEGNTLLSGVELLIDSIEAQNQRYKQALEKAEKLLKDEQSSHAIAARFTLLEALKESEQDGDKQKG